MSEHIVHDPAAPAHDDQPPAEETSAEARGDGGGPPVSHAILWLENQACQALYMRPELLRLRRFRDQVLRLLASPGAELKDLEKVTDAEILSHLEDLVAAAAVARRDA